MSKFLDIFLFRWNSNGGWACSKIWIS